MTKYHSQDLRSVYFCGRNKFVWEKDIRKRNQSIRCSGFFFCMISTDQPGFLWKRLPVRQHLQQLAFHLGQRSICNDRILHFWDLACLEKMVGFFFLPLIFLHALFSLQLSISVSLHTQAEHTPKTKSAHCAHTEKP